MPTIYVVQNIIDTSTEAFTSAELAQAYYEMRVQIDRAQEYHGGDWRSPIETEVDRPAILAAMDKYKSGLLPYSARATEDGIEFVGIDTQLDLPEGEVDYFNSTQDAWVFTWAKDEAAAAQQALAYYRAHMDRLKPHLTTGGRG